MFNSLRKKVSEAFHEGLSLSDNITTLRHSHPANVSKIELGIPPNINLEVGTNLLQEAEETWKHLHEANEINAEKAEAVDDQISKIKRRNEKLFVDLTDIIVCLGAIPQIEKNLAYCLEMVQTLKPQCQSCEMKLAELEDLSEEISLQERELEHKVQLTLYKQKKLSELEVIRRKLVDHHEENVHRFENDLKKIQQERQAVFQDAFQQDLEVYKKQGSIPKVECVLSTPTLLLEEIVLDNEENNKELENFLNE